MLRTRNLFLVVCMLLYSSFCGAEIGRGSQRNHFSERQNSRIETIDIQDAGGKTRKNSFVLNMTMPGAHSVKVGGSFSLIFSAKAVEKILPVYISIKMHESIL